MTTSSPGPRRRRIAGERKVARPAADAPQPDQPAPSTPPANHSPASSSAAPPAADQPPAAPAAPTTAAGAAAASRPRRAAPRALLVSTIAAATVLLLVAAAVALVVDGAGWDDWRRVQNQQAVDRAVRTAPAAAERAAEAVLAYDYRTLEADRDAAAATMTPEYRRKYLETFGELVMGAARDQKARVQADVRASGVALPGADRVQVLLFVNQTTVSTANSGEPQIALNRVVLTMERTGRTWLVDDITSY